METATQDPVSLEDKRREAEEKAAAEAGSTGNGNGGEPVSHEGGGELEGEGDEGAPDERQPLPIPEIPGDGQLTLTVGGTKPDSSTVKMRGGKIEVVEGDFDKGATIDLVVKGVVAEVHFVDRRDDYGNVVGTERRHIVKALAVERLGK